MNVITSEEYIQYLEHLMSNESLSCEDIKLDIRFLITQTPVSFQQIPFSFIVRTSVLGINEACSNISRCTYNPDSRGIPLQRCNYAEQQVFYGSVPGGMKNLGDAAQSSFMETCFDRIKEDPSFSDRFIVSTKWTLKKAPLLWVLPFHVGSIELNENFDFLFRNFDTYLQDNSQTTSQYLDLKRKVEYLSGLYCKNENKKVAYKITATFHNELRDLFNAKMEDKIDGLIYPSANTGGEGMNMVLNKEFIANENIVCDLAVLYHYRRNETNARDISFFPVAEAIPTSSGELSFEPLKE